MAKVRIKEILKTKDSLFDIFDENKIIFQAGNTLCIKEINNNNHNDFICLNKNLNKLLCFKPTPNKKSIFTAERINNKLEIANYTFKDQRKSIILPENNGFFENMENIQLLVDQFDSNLIYGAVKCKTDACIFLIDINRLKIIAIGFIPIFEDIKVNFKQNLTLSICGKTFVKVLHVSQGIWQQQDRNLKKIPTNLNIIKHELMFSQRIIICSWNKIYVLDSTDVIQIINLPEEAITIKHLLKFPQGFIIVASNNSLYKYHQQSSSQQQAYLLKQTIPLQYLNQQQFIIKIILSPTNQDIFLKTNFNKIFIWKLENDYQINSNKINIHKIYDRYFTQTHGFISIADSKRYCMLAGTNTISLWDLQRNQILITTSYYDYQFKDKSIIQAFSMNPDANSFLVAMDDKIKNYSILLNNFKLNSQLSLKKCKLIQYSHGGNMAACKYGKSSNSCISIIDTLRMYEIHILKLYCQIKQIQWSKLDNELVVLTSNNTINWFQISNASRKNLEFNQTINYIRYAYHINKLIASTSSKIFVIEDYNIIESIISSIENFHYVFPLHQTYFAVDTIGTLYWSKSLNFQIQSSVSLFPNKTMKLVYSNNLLLAYDSFENVIIIQCNFLGKSQKKYPNENFAFIQKSQIQRLFQNVKTLEINFDNLTTSSGIKVDDIRKKYDETIQETNKKFQLQIEFMKQKNDDLQEEKNKQEKHNGRIFQEQDKGHIANADEIEKMYTRKLNIESQRYMDLEQQNLQQKMNYEKIIINLETKYDHDIKLVREKYADQLKNQYHKLNQNKSLEIKYKQKMESKLIDIEEQNQITLYELQKNKDLKILQLSEKVINLQRQFDQNQVNLYNKDSDLTNMINQMKNQSENLNKSKMTLQQQMNKIHMLEQEIKKKNKMVEQRNQIIQNQNHQINGLEKAKYVLSFRTTEIRKEMEPKEALIDKLKSQLFKLDDQYKIERKKTYDLSQKIQKLEKIKETVKQENIKYQINIKNKQKMYDDLCYQIFMIVNNEDAKDWNTSLVKVYQLYIKQDHLKLKGNNKKDKVTQEFDKHLNHLERNLTQLKQKQKKQSKSKEQDVIRKIMENAELVLQLNTMRKQLNENQKNIKQKNNEIAHLNRQLMMNGKNSTRTNTAQTGLTRRVIQSRQKQSQRKDFSGIDLNHKEKQQLSIEPNYNARSRISSARKTMLWKPEEKKQKRRIFDMAHQLEISRNTIRKKDKMIEELNQRLLGIPEEQLQ